MRPRMGAGRRSRRGTFPRAGNTCCSKTSRSVFIVLWRRLRDACVALGWAFRSMGRGVPPPVGARHASPLQGDPQRSEGLDGVPDHLEPALLAEHPPDPGLLLPLRDAVDSKELVQGPVEQLRVLP